MVSQHSLLQKLNKTNILQLFNSSSFVPLET